MTKEREALKLALEDLKWIKIGMGCKDIDATIQSIEEALMSLQDGTQPEHPDLDAICQDLQETTYNQAMRIAELEAQLAQPEQLCGFDLVLDESMPPNTFKLAQPSVSVEQEPVAWPHKFGCRANAFGKCNMGCTTPPQRKSLTDEQMQFLATAIGQAQQIIDTHNADFVTARDDLRRCAELLAAHGIREKNT